MPSSAKQDKQRQQSQATLNNTKQKTSNAEQRQARQATLAKVSNAKQDKHGQGKPSKQINK